MKKDITILKEMIQHLESKEKALVGGLAARAQILKSDLRLGQIREEVNRVLLVTKDEGLKQSLEQFKKTIPTPVRISEFWLMEADKELKKTKEELAYLRENVRLHTAITEADKRIEELKAQEQEQIRLQAEETEIRRMQKDERDKLVNQYVALSLTIWGKNEDRSCFASSLQILPTRRSSTSLTPAFGVG
jgi:hypothetical protein